ncbi:MAG: transposase [Defluviitaleaceae bacterium]|nr:transposase [Defluviitaleaceae bacterium]MCL2262907.1 transposase [Defluviitaleaceae bacterium]
MNAENFTDEQCKQYLFDKRWANGFVCPKCGGGECFNIKSRGLFQCKHCNYQSSVTAGTLFDKTRTPLKKWFAAIRLLAQNEKISAAEIGREINVSYFAAVSVLKKIRQAAETDCEIVNSLLAKFKIPADPPKPTDEIIFTDEKNSLLSIGEMAKLTGMSIRSFRYYEQINILKPAYINEETKYRYYSLEQLQLVEIINFCIELDIPLKELADLEELYGDMDFQNFLSRGKEIAKRKLAAINKGLKLIERIEQKIEIEKQCKAGEIYIREVPQKTLYVKPAETTNGVITETDMVKAFLDMPIPQAQDSSFSDYGILCEVSPNGAKYLYFMEVASGADEANTITLPAGNYICCRSENHQINKAAEIFNCRKNSFTVVETYELSVGKNASNKFTLWHELRMLL